MKELSGVLSATNNLARDLISFWNDLRLASWSGRITEESQNLSKKWIGLQEGFMDLSISVLQALGDYPVVAPTSKTSQARSTDS
jgi:hypothetical protein